MYFASSYRSVRERCSPSPRTVFAIASLGAEIVFTDTTIAAREASEQAPAGLLT
jgi:hypothetical protein